MIVIEPRDHAFSFRIGATTISCFLEPPAGNGNDVDLTDCVGTSQFVDEGDLSVDFVMLLDASTGPFDQPHDVERPDVTPFSVLPW